MTSETVSTAVSMSYNSASNNYIIYFIDENSLGLIMSCRRDPSASSSLMIMILVTS